MKSVDDQRNGNTLSAMVDGKWQPKRSDCYATDCAAGNAIAGELIEIIARTGNPAFMGMVIRAMVEAGNYAGIETGFCSKIGVTLLVNR